VNPPADPQPPGSSTPPPSPVAPGRVPPHGSASRVAALAVGTFRLLVTRPLRRLALRAMVWRLVVGPRVRGRGIRRDRGMRQAEAARSAGVCAACRRPPRRGERGSGWQADHRRPLWAGGADHPDNLWTLCTECHGIKTRAERRARRWRDRAFGLAALEKAPAYVWGGLVGVLAAVGHLVGVLPHPGLSLLLAVVVAWGFWRTMPKGGGMNGVDDLDAKIEESGNDTVGHAAGAAMWWRRKYHGTRVTLGLGAHLYLVVRVVPLVVAWYLGA
jgi:hypothetical protein